MKWFCSQAASLLRLGVLALIIGSFTACGGGNQLSGGNPDVITQEQIENAGSVGNAYLLVQHLHPDWLQGRGSNSIQNRSDVVVYVEGSRRGGPDALRSISVVNVRLIRHLNSSEATLEHGSGHDHGAIEVELKEQ